MGAPRQDRTRSFNLRFLLLALVSFSVVAGLYFIESRRISSIARAHRDAESRALDDRFIRESDRIEAKLQELKSQALRTVSAGDRRRLPKSIVSVSLWSKTSAGITRIPGFEAEGVWEQALFKVLPLEIAKRPARAVLPLAGPELAADPSAETLRLAIFPGTGAEPTVAIAFRPSALFAGMSSDGMKRYLIEESGLVLAHTSPSETGIRTSALADLYRRTALESTDPQRAHRLASKSWEGFPSTIRFARLPGWSAFFVMEKVHVPVQAAASPYLILSFIAGGLLGLFFLVLSFVRPRGEAAVTEIISPPPAPVSTRRESPFIPVTATGRLVPRQGLKELRNQPPAFVPRPSAISLPSLAPATAEQMQSELGKFIAAREARSESHEANRIRRETILLEEFERDARHTRDIAKLEAKLVESVSGATKSPVLFFRYDPLQGIARLSAEAGYPSTQSIIGAGGMSFALETALVTDIHADIARGRPKNLWDYAPLGRVMLSRLGIANFEAWPMTEARRPNAGPSRLLGIIVVAESGVDSVLHRDFLGAILERASRHYARQNA